MADLKIIDKNMQKIIEWVNAADLMLMKMDSMLKSHDLDLNELKKSSHFLKDNSPNNTEEVIKMVESLQKNLENLHKDLIELKKDVEENKRNQNYDKEELLNLFSVFDIRLQNLEKSIQNQNQENVNNSDDYKNNDLPRSKNRSKKL